MAYIFYFLGIIISLAAGFLFIRLLTGGRLNIILHLLLALALGLGLVGTVTFYTHILFNQSYHWFPVGIVILGIVVLILNIYRYPSLRGAKRRGNLNKIGCSFRDCFALRTRNDVKSKNVLGLLTLFILALPLTIGALHYPLGGWDAWSCWNLKAKFIFLGQDHWKDVLSPGLWRSNTHYPLLWPLVNVWFWDLSGRFDQIVPMLNSIVIALLTAGILLFGLLELTGLLWVSIAAAILVTALPFGVTLLISQYSDSLLGLYLLAAFTCFLLAEKYNLPKLKMLSVIFLGLMSFTKNEGLMASGIAALLIFWHERSHKKDLKSLILAYFIALLPTIIFTLGFAPKNEAFINGLTSADKHTNWARISILMVYPWFEFISGKWNGFWFLVLGGIILAGKRLWQSTLGVMGFALILYLGVVMAYYAVNTFFEIGWWLSTTLSRILFALVPTIVLWIALGLAE